MIVALLKKIQPLPKTLVGTIWRDEGPLQEAGVEGTG